MQKSKPGKAKTGKSEPRSTPKRVRITDGSVGHGNKSVLSGINVQIEEGDACLLSGPNGSGKTTLMRTLLGLLRPVSGSIDSTFRRIGYVPQEKTIDRQFPVTIRACLHMSFPGFRYAIQGKLRRERTEIVERALELVGLQGKAEQQLASSSGGEIQRTLIARALVRSPDLLVMDEPTSSLDKAGKAEVIAILRRLHKEGMTLLITTHEAEPEDRLFTHLITIDQGRVSKEKARRGGRS